MGVDHDRNVGWRDPDLLQASLEHRGTVGALVLEPVDVLELLVLLVARTGVDEDEARRVLDQKAPHAELNPVPLVGGDALFPERLWNDADHGAAVESLPPGLDRVNRQAADFAALHERTRRRHAVVSRVTGVGNPDALRLLRRPLGVRS